VNVRRKDQFAYIYLERVDGSDGDIACVLNTKNNIEALGGKKQAVEHVDFVPVMDKKIEFKHNVTEVRIEVEMPDCTQDNSEDADIITFALEISSPSPDGVKLSKKNLCFIDITPEDENEEKRASYER